MKKDMPLEGLRWSRDSGSALYDTPPNGRSRTGWGARKAYEPKHESIHQVSHRGCVLCYRHLPHQFVYGGARDR